MRSLLEKLDGLDLTEGERHAFGLLMGVEDDEVEGFGLQQAGPTVQGFNLGVVLERIKLRGVGRPYGATSGDGGVVDHKADD